MNYFIINFQWGRALVWGLVAGSGQTRVILPFTLPTFIHTVASENQNSLRSVLSLETLVRGALAIPNFGNKKPSAFSRNAQSGFDWDWDWGVAGRKWIGSKFTMFKQFFWLFDKIVTATMFDFVTLFHVRRYQIRRKMRRK